MIELQELHLKNVVYIKQAAIKFIPGLTFVRGLNRDSGILETDASSNGAGKSLLFSTIPNVTYFAPPLSIRKKDKKEILRKTDASIGITFKSGEHVYTVCQSPSKYKVLKDGTDLKIRTVPLAEQYIRQIFPLSEVLFYTTCYVSTQKLYPFQNDSDLLRLEHLISVFALNNYEKLKVHFSQLLTTLKSQEVKLGVLEQRKDVLKADVAKYDSVTDNQVDPELKSKLDAEYRELDKKSKSIVALIHGYQVTLRDLRSLLDVETRLHDLRKVWKHREGPKEVRARLRSELKAAHEWTAFHNLNQNYKSKRRSLRLRLKQLEKPENDEQFYSTRIKVLRKSQLAFEEQLRVLDAKQKEYKEAERQLELAVERVKELGLDPHDPKCKPKILHIISQHDIESRIAQSRVTLKLKALLDHEHEDGLCPTCTSVVDYKAIRALVKQARTELRTLELLEQQQQALHTWKSRLLEYKDSTDFTTEIQQVRSEIKKRISDTKQAELLRDQARVWSELSDSIKSLHAPAQPESEEPAGDASSIERQLELCDQILSTLSQKSHLLDASDLRSVLGDYKDPTVIQREIKSLESRVKQADSEALVVRTRLKDVADEKMRLERAQSEYDLYMKEYRKVCSEIEVLKPGLEKRQVLEVLIKAYGNRGLRVLAASKICGLLEQNLNQYRHLVFCEPFTFQISVSDSGMSILVDRGNGQVSDVRSLSGAESNCYRLLFVLSILSLIPSSMRTNMLVLDEPTSHSDLVTRTLFLERYLPAITQIVPCVYVITPHASDAVPGSAEWLVVKHNGVSTVVTANQQM